MATTQYLVNPPSIFVDDSETAIQYNGTWTTINEEDIPVESFTDRMPLLNTLHVLEIFNGSFSYRFTGVGVSIFTTPADNSTFTCQCLLDGVPLNFTPNGNDTQNQPICAAFDLPADVRHTISVFVSVPPRSQQPSVGSLSGFAFDYILVKPASAKDLWQGGTDDVFLQAQGANFTTSPHVPQQTSALLTIPEGLTNIGNIAMAWGYDAQNGFHTTTPGSQFNVTFTGTSIWWYGYVNSTDLSNHQPFSATFAIDGGATSTVGVPGGGNVSSSQSYFFKTPVILDATHTLSVVNHGNDTSIPFTMQSLIIRRFRQAVLASSSEGISLPFPTMSQAPSTTPTLRHTNHSGLAGGIGGGVTFFLLVLCALLCLIRRKRGRQIMKRKTQSTTVVREPFPAPSEGTVRTGVPRKARPSQENVDHPLMHQQLPEPLTTKWTRHNQNPESPRHVSSTSATVIQELGRPESSIDHPHIVDDPHHHFVASNDVNVQSTPDFYPTRIDAINVSDPFVIGDEREEERLPQREFIAGLPPAYTTHV